MNQKINNVIVSKNIKIERVKCGMTADAVAKELNLSRNTYYKYEKDAKSLSIDTIIKLSKLFNCNIENFFTS